MTEVWGLTALWIGLALIATLISVGLHVLATLSEIVASTVVSLALVAAGGFLGGIGRFLVSGALARRIGETFPWGTLAVNVSGSFLIGILAAWIGSGSVDTIWIAAAIGILGSYTTVSSFSLQTLALARDREWLPATFNIVGSLVLCLGAVFLGLIVGTAL